MFLLSLNKSRVLNRVVGEIKFNDTISSHVHTDAWPSSLQSVIFTSPFHLLIVRQAHVEGGAKQRTQDV